MIILCDRKFMASDVPSNVSKMAPEFCNVYVISKGRISSVQSATIPVPNPPPRPLQIQSNPVPRPADACPMQNNTARGIILLFYHCHFSPTDPSLFVAMRNYLDPFLQLRGQHLYLQTWLKTQKTSSEFYQIQPKVEATIRKPIILSKPEINVLPWTSMPCCRI